MSDRLRQRLRTGEQGFTLIELLIVIVILGVLAGIVVFAVGGLTDTSQTSACKSDKKTVQTAVEAYYADESPHQYPAQWSDLTSGSRKYLSEESEWHVPVWRGATSGTVGSVVVKPDTDTFTNPCD